MSFICGFCFHVSPENTPQRLVTIAWREKTYHVDGRQFMGQEIVAEARQCQKCFDKTPEAVTAKRHDGRQYLTATIEEKKNERQQANPRTVAVDGAGPSSSEA